MNAKSFSMSEPTARLGRIAILWRGDEAARRSATPETSRFKAVFAALAEVGVDAEPVVYEDDVLDAVRAQLAHARRRARLGQSDPRGAQPRQSRRAAARGRGAWRLGERPSRCDPQDGHQGGAASYPHDELGLRHGPLSNGRGDARRIAGAARRRPARDQAQPRQRRPGRLEGRDAGKSTQPADGPRAGCHQGRIGGAGAGRISSSGASSISKTAA